LAKLRKNIKIKIDNKMHIPRGREKLIVLAVRKKNNINKYAKQKKRITFKLIKRKRNTFFKKKQIYRKARFF
jgi:hypothetical protein